MNLFIHRLWMWFAVLTALVGIYSVYLGALDHRYHCLPHSGFVYVIYGSLVVVMSLWSVDRMAGHIFDIKVQRAIAYWNKHWSDRAKSN